ncbi:PAS domain S-box protein [Candidatus Parabeggiatoa sp. HSG14]|uniref:PAS domain S-box protein n=1 Tax=Candidatus Parabeggiatoa sp. HSG14 TaxID=3055593 RepID=UPI0025A85C80|nr:PAS domain S-box protein [Thiotrichales bacterium HSG14]
MTQQFTERSLHYEQTLTTCSRRLLGSHYNEDPLTDILTYLQQATSVSRVSLFKNFTDFEQGLYTQCTHQVASNSIKLSKKNINQKWSYQQGLNRWKTLLSQGKIISGHIDDFPASEKLILKTLETLSLLIIPIKVAEQWNGFICFNDITSQRKWNNDDIHLLQIAAELIGTYLTRRQKEIHWREHETRYNEVVSALQEGVVLEYADGRVAACNASVQRILGIKADQAISLTAIDSSFQIIYEDGTPFPKEELPAQITLRTGQPCSNVVLGIKISNENLIWLSINSQPLWHDKPQKQPYAVVSTFTDITERKQMEDALALSEKRFRTIFNSAAVAITLINSEDNYIQFNTKWLDMLGYSAKEMRLKKNIELCHPHDEPALETLMRDIERGHIDHFRTEIRFIHKNGKILWGDLSSSAFHNRKSGLEAIISIIMDITERKQIEEERDRLFNFSVDMQCIIGFDGYFKQLNAAWEYTLSHRREYLLTEAFLTFVHPDDWQATHSVFERLLQGHSVQSFENRYRCQDNSYRWFSWNAYPLVEQQKIYAIIRDITDIKQNEVALKDAHERLLTILDSLGSLVYVADMQTYELLYVNKYGQNAFGEIVSGQLCWKTLHKEQNQPCSQCSNSQLLNDKGEPTGVYTSEIQDKGTGKWYLTHDRAIRWVDGRLVRLQIATDITARKRTEEALKINEHRYRAIVQDQTELICRYLPDGRLSFVNEAYCRYFNTTEAELIGHFFTPLISNDMQVIITQMMDSLNRKTPVIETEHSSILNGKEHWQHWVGRAVFNEKGKLVEYQIVGRDITERKQTEAELRRAKEAAEAATRAKSEFLANMSHEIRTPMNGVVGMTELLLNTELTSQQREYAVVIHQSTDALQTIINDILDFSKIEAGKLTLECTVFDLEAAVLEVARLLAMAAELKGYELIVRYAPDAPRHFVGDAGRIRQIITNLAGNAIKFTSKGHVFIDVDCQVQTFESTCMIFKIEDTGIGIPSEKLETIFDEFTQADASTTRQFGGTGLGLAISQQLVKMMNGEIGVVSELNKGSTFTFTLSLPLAEIYDDDIHKEISDFQPEENQNLQPLQKTRILIVDDNRVNQRILVEQLEGMKIRTQAVDSAKTAMMALREAQKQNDPYWLAIIDYFMPITDGEELGKLIKKERKLKNTILIMLSSAGYQQESTQLQQVGFSAHLIKPLPQHQLQKTLLFLKASFDNPHQALNFITMEHVNKFQFKRHRKIYPNTPVLLVEDNDVNRMVAVSMLEQLGCYVTQAVNGLEALKILEEHRFAVIFMDIQMPELDGFEATQLIRKRETGSNQHHVIVAMTANAMQGDAEHCLAAGMDDYIAKPISLERIFDVLKKYCPSYQTNVIQPSSLGEIPSYNSQFSLKKDKNELAKIKGEKIQLNSKPMFTSSQPKNFLKETTGVKQPKIDKKILLAEDNEVNRLVITNMLETLECTVEIVENGKQAVKICADKDYDLILMDIRMPVMDGIQATKLIRQTGKNRHTPIIAVTANSQPNEVKRYIEIGMNDCVGKPVSLERLRIMIKTYMSTKNEVKSTNTVKDIETTNISPSVKKKRGKKKAISSKASSPSKKEKTKKASPTTKKISPQPLQPQSFTEESEKLEGETPPEDLLTFDIGQAKRIAIGNLNILKKIIDKFSQDTPQQIEKLQIALQEGNQKEMERLAHSLKGSARSVGALRLGEIAFFAETAASESNLTQLEDLVTQLIEELEQLEEKWEKTDWETLL